MNLQTIILDSLLKFGELFPKSKRERLVESLMLFSKAIDASLERDEVSEFKLYQQAISVCPENPVPYWKVISFLHQKKRDEEAFEFFEKVKNLDYHVFSEILNNPQSYKLLVLGARHFDLSYNLAMSRSAAVGMLVALGKLDVAKETLASSMLLFWGNERRGPWSPWGMFMSDLPIEVCQKPLDYCKDFIRILLEISTEKDFLESELQSCYDACIESMARGAFYLVRVGKLIEALAIVEFVLNTEIKNFNNTSRNELISLQKTIHDELKGAKKWEQVMSDDEFLSFLFKRLAFKFHPDLETDEQERVKKTKIMQEINRAKDEKNLKKLEDIVNKHVPEWSKYLKNRK